MYKHGELWHHPEYGIGSVIRSGVGFVDLKFLAAARRITNDRCLQKIHYCKFCNLAAPEFFGDDRALVELGSSIICRHCYTNLLLEHAKRNALRQPWHENDDRLRGCFKCKRKLNWEEIRFSPGRALCTDCRCAPPPPWWKRLVPAVSGEDICGGPGV